MYNVIKRVFTFSVVASTIMWSVGVAALIPSVAQGATCPTLAAGDMVKVTGKAAIYAVNNDLKVLYFPSGDEFKSWRPTYGGYISITQECFDSLSVPTAYPGAVNYHPGSYVVKRPSSDQLYVVEPSNTLAKITAAAATTLYGAGYKVMTVADTFWPHYVSRGSDISTGIAHPGFLAKVDGVTYYVDSDSKLRVVTAAGMTANGFQERFVHTLTSAAIAGLTAGAEISAEIKAVTDKTQSGGVTGGQTTNFSVSLASDNPAGANIPAKTTNLSMLKFVVGGTGTVSEVVVKRGGVGASTDFSAVYLYNGSTRLTSGRTVASDTGNVTFTNLGVTAPATLTVVADIAAAPGANTNNFSVVKVNSDTVNVAGNYFTINSTISASTATVAEVTASWEVVLGTSQAEVGKFSITGGTNDQTVSRVTLRQGGSLANSNLKNLKLYQGSTLVATADALVGDKAIMSFTVPFSIPKSQQKNFTLYADIVGGRTADDINFYIDEDSDVAVTDVLYGVGADITNNFALNDQTVTMAGGQITLASNGPAATTYAANTTNLDLYKFSLSSERNITIKKSKITITTTTAGIFNNAHVKNIKVVDLDSGNTLVGPYSTLASLTADTASIYAVTSSDSFDVSAGTTRHLAIRADFDTSLTDGAVVKAGFFLGGANFVYDNDASEYVAATKIVPNTISGNNITGSTASLTITKTATPANNTAVRGTQDVELLGINFAAGTSDSLKLNKVTVRFYADTAATFHGTAGATSGAGDTAANTIITSASLWDGTTQVGTLKGLTLDSGTTFTADDSYYTASFTNLAYAIPKGTQKKLVVKVNLTNTYLTTKYVAADLDKNADIEAENSNGNLVTISTAQLNGGTDFTPSPYLTAYQSGSLVISVDGATPQADISVMGNTGVAFTKYKLRATNEAFTIVGAKIVSDYTSTAGDKDVNLTKVIVEYKDANGNTVPKDGYLSDGALTFADGQLEIPVPINQDTYITIKGDLNTDTGGAYSGRTLKLGLEKETLLAQWGTTTTAGNNALSDNFIALGVSSNNKLYGNTNSTTIVSASSGIDHTNINAQTISKTKVTVANNMADRSGSQQTSDKVGVFSFTSTGEPGSNQKSTLVSTTIQLKGSFLAPTGDTVVTASFYNGATYDAAHLMGSVLLDVASSSATNATGATFTNMNEFEGTINVHVVVDTTDTDLYAVAGSNKTLGCVVTTYKWKDGNNDATDSVTSPVTGVPVTGGNVTYSL
ncbi:MAG: hypothetical protein PHD72_02420 [Patescibacteria group bacterium]|nr:hypothetical protein [Patescibacteria group bacterium]